MIVVLTEDAERDLSRLDRKTASRVASRLQWLAAHFEGHSAQPLGGALRGYCKLRVGDWRVIYETDHRSRTLTVHAIDHRRTVYRDH